MGGDSTRVPKGTPDRPGVATPREQYQADEKYRAQVQAVMKYLKEGLGSEIYLQALLARPGAKCLEEVLRPALASQEGERASAQAMLELLQALVVEADERDARQAAASARAQAESGDSMDDSVGDQLPVLR